MGPVEWVRAQTAADSTPTGRPFITLSYAQSLDGSIAARPGQATQISCDASLDMTHRLRAIHDGILVGVSTVIADDPKLTVRRAAGPNPRPIVLDSNLRIPINSWIIDQSPLTPWIATTHHASGERATQLERVGATVIRLPSDTTGTKVSIPALLEELERRGVATLMVEGGAEVISSFMDHRLVDYVVLTIAPLYLRGLRSMGSNNGQIPRQGSDGSVDGFPCLRKESFQWLEQDLVIWGDMDWGNGEKP